MFDWDDSEIASILWDEGADNGDHIVPYPKRSEDCQNTKECKEETAIVKHIEQEKPSAKSERGSTLINHDGSSASGMGMERWPDLALSNGSTAERDSVSTKVPNNLTEIANYDSERGTDQLDKDSEIYESNPEGKEQGDFVDYGWANIGSFDDLDRIFSNNDDVFGHSNLGSADGLWSSSRSVDGSAVKPFPMSSEFPDLVPGTPSNASQHLEIKTEYAQTDDLSCSLSYGKTEKSTSQSLHSGRGILNHTEEKTSVDTVGNRTVSTSLPATQDVAIAGETSYKVGKQKKQTKSRKRMEEKIHGKPLQEPYGSWSSSIIPSGQLENLAHPVTQHLPSTVQQMQFPGPELFPYQHVPNQFLVRPVYGNIPNPYPAMPMMSYVQPGKHQQLLPGYNVSPPNRNPVNKSAQAPVKPIMMTPQEKIEKLRRRQQLRAMLAIEKQQQKLGQQVSSSTHSALQSCPQKNQARADLEIDDLTTFSPLDSNSPREQDDSNTISASIDDYSMEEMIPLRLQEIIEKLDMTVRICIRDSLFRLAKSAMQRQNATDASSSNRISKDEHDALAKEEINSYSRLQDGETETNPIDRTVAHLLFHRPLELLGKHSDASESPRSIKLPSEHKAPPSAPNMPEALTNQPLAEPDQYKDSPCLDTSENASRVGLPDGGTVTTVGVDSLNEQNQSL